MNQSYSQSTASPPPSPITTIGQEDLEHAVASGVEQTKAENIQAQKRLEECYQAKLERATTELGEARQRQLALEKELQSAKEKILTREAIYYELREEILRSDEQIEVIESQLENRLQSLENSRATETRLRERIHRAMHNFTFEYNQSVKNQETFWRFGSVLWLELIQTRDFQTKINDPSFQNIVRFAYTILGYNERGENVSKREFSQAEGLDAVGLFVDYDAYPFDYDEKQKSNDGSNEADVRKGEETEHSQKEDETHEANSDIETVTSDAGDDSSVEEVGFGEEDRDQHPGFAIFEDETATGGVLLAEAANTKAPATQNDRPTVPLIDTNVPRQPGFRVPSPSYWDESDY